MTGCGEDITKKEEIMSVGHGGSLTSQINILFYFITTDKSTRHNVEASLFTK